MEATNTSSVQAVADPPLTGIAFYMVGEGYFYRDAETGRVFGLDVNFRKLAGSLASDANSFEDAAVDVAGVARWREVSPNLIIGAWAIRENEIDPLIADDLHELADEIEAHVEACPLPRLAH